MILAILTLYLYITICLIFQGGYTMYVGILMLSAFGALSMTYLMSILNSVIRYIDYKVGEDHE